MAVTSEPASVEACSNLFAEEVFEDQDFECGVLNEAGTDNSSIARGPSVKVGKNCKVHISKCVKLSCSF
jgi:hypothetical protein